MDIGPLEVMILLIWAWIIAGIVIGIVLFQRYLDRRRNRR